MQEFKLKVLKKNDIYNMYLLPLNLMFFLMIYGDLKGQSDSIKCEFNCKIKEGIYLSYNDFRTLNPILKEQVESDVNKTHLDFIGKALSEDKITFQVANEKIIVDCKNIWGYYQNNALHLNFAGNFNRVTQFGSISYMIATVEVMSPGMYTPGYGGMMGTTVRTQEVRNYLMNFYDGKIIPFSQKDAELLISRDTNLFKEYKSLRSKQRREQISRYIRKFNEQNPIYFLK